MGRRKSQIARGSNIAWFAEKMGESAVAEPETLGLYRWKKQFTTRGLPKWVYHMEIVSPYTNGFLAVHPDLTEEQRQVAVKEFLRRYREGFPAFLQSIAMESFNFAKSFVVPVVARSKKPSAGFPSGLLF